MQQKQKQQQQQQQQQQQRLHTPIHAIIKECIYYSFEFKVIIMHIGIYIES